MMTDRLVDLLSRSSGIVVVSALLITGAAVTLGIGLNSPDRFLDLREWARAIGDCLRQL
jgi:hypothetical protein